MFLGAVGVRVGVGVWRSLYSFLKKPIILVISGGGGVQLSPSPPLYGFVTHEIMIISRNDRCSPNIRE